MPFLDRNVDVHVAKKRQVLVIQKEPGASQIVDALIPLVMEEIIEVVRRIPHERIRCDNRHVRS